jgi:hypothetical protein
MPFEIRLKVYMCCKFSRIYSVLFEKYQYFNILPNGNKNVMFLLSIG